MESGYALEPLRGRVWYLLLIPESTVLLQFVPLTYQFSQLEY